MSSPSEHQQLIHKIDHLHNMLHAQAEAIHCQGMLLNAIALGVGQLIAGAGTIDPKLVAALDQSKAHHDKLKAVLDVASK